MLLELSQPSLSMLVSDLRKTTKGQEEIKALTPAKFRTLLQQLQTALTPKGVERLKFTGTIPVTAAIDASNFPSLFRASRRQLGETISRRVTKLKQYIEEASAAQRRRWTRSVRLILEEPPPSRLSLVLELDSGATFDLTMWLLFNNLVPNSPIVKLEVFYRDASSHEGTVPYPVPQDML